MEVYSLAYLPDEVLEIIFKNLSGTSFINCRKTCRRLNAVTIYFEHHCSIWKVFCVNEVEPNALMELLRNKTVDFINKKNAMVEAENEFWKNVYIKWYRTQFISNYTCVQKQLDYNLSRTTVNCIKISGDCLLTGHNNGSILMWNACLGTLLRRMGQHEKTVMDMALVDLFNYGNYGSSDFLLEHHHLITGGNDRILLLIQLHCIEGESLSPAVRLPELPFQIDTLSIFENSLIVKSRGVSGFLYVYKITATSIANLEISLLYGINQFVELKMKWMGFWANQLIMITDDMVQYTFCLSKREYVSRHPTILENPSDIGSPASLPVKACYMFQKDIIVFLTINNYLCLSNDGEHFRAYSTLACMKGNVTSVAILGKNIAFGTNVGSVYLYNFKDNKNFPNLNLKEPVWKRKFADSAVIAIDFWLDTSTILMAASTRDTIFVFRWSPRSSQQPLPDTFFLSNLLSLN